VSCMVAMDVAMSPSVAFFLLSLEGMVVSSDTKMLCPSCRGLAVGSMRLGN
jgi:hypothetical protein